jgi:hypothetical protein
MRLIRLPMRCSFASVTESTGTVKIVNQSSANRTFFHLRMVDQILASFAERDEGADRNAWL